MTTRRPGLPRWPRWALDLVTAPLQARQRTIIGWVVAMLAVFTVVTYVVGGTSFLPPHWFYLPIVVAGARFGVIGSLTTAVVSGLLVGPLMPAVVETGIPQQSSEWLIRAGFFVVVGTVATALTRQAGRGIVSERKWTASARRLEQALESGQLRLHFQPIVSAESGDVTGAEALLRWASPDSRLLNPDEFVPLAEQTGQIVPIGAWVLDQACAQLEAWSGSLNGVPLVMSVNVAPAQIVDGQLVSIVLDALRRHDIDPRRLCLEITESSILPDTARSFEVLSTLRQLGVSIAIDDFGTGMSSLSYLRSIPFDTLKIDGHFIEGLGETRAADTVVESITKLATDLNKKTVAEKVETRAQWERLIASGCTHGQGYLFAPPLPPQAFLALMTSQQPVGRFEASS